MVTFIHARHCSQVMRVNTDRLYIKEALKCKVFIYETRHLFLLKHLARSIRSGLGSETSGAEKTPGLGCKRPSSGIHGKAKAKPSTRGGYSVSTSSPSEWEVEGFPRENSVVSLRLVGVGCNRKLNNLVTSPCRRQAKPIHSGGARAFSQLRMNATYLV